MADRVFCTHLRECNANDECMDAVWLVLGRTAGGRMVEQNLDEFEADNAKLQADCAGLKASATREQTRAQTAERRLEQIEAELGGALAAKNAAVDESVAEAEEAKRQLKELASKHERLAREESTVVGLHLPHPLPALPCPAQHL